VEEKKVCPRSAYFGRVEQAYLYDKAEEESEEVGRVGQRADAEETRKPASEHQPQNLLYLPEVELIHSQ